MQRIKFQLSGLMLAVFIHAGLAHTALASTVTFTTSDGWTIGAAYHPPQDDHTVAIIIKGSSDTAIWAALAARLESQGMGTLSFDLRGYGTNTHGPYGITTYRNFTDDTWPACINDIHAAVGFLKNAGIDEDRIALVGGLVAANVVSMAATLHPEAAWLLLFSPSNDYHGLSVGMGTSLPTLAVASQNDEEAQAACQRLEEKNDDTTCLIGPDGRGVALLQDKALFQDVMDWIEQVP